MNSTRLLICSLTLILLWGTAFNLVGVAIEYISAMQLVAGRTVLAAVILSVYILAVGKRFPPIRDVRWIWYLALGQTGITLPFWLIAVGQETIDSGLSAVLTGAMPLMTIVLAHFFADERLTRLKTLGFTIGFIGICVLFLPEVTGLVSGGGRGQVLSLIAPMLFAASTIAAKRAPETDSAIGGTIMVIGGAMSACLYVAVQGLPSAMPAPMAWGAIGLLGVGSTAFGTILYLYMIDKAGPTAVARINYYPPVVAVAVGWAFLDEPFSPRTAIAFAIIAAGMWIARARSQPRPTPAIPSSS